MFCLCLCHYLIPPSQLAEQTWNLPHFNVLSIKLKSFAMVFLFFVVHDEQSQSKSAEFFSATFPSWSAGYMFVYIKICFCQIFDSSAGRELWGVLGAAFKFVRHYCKLSVLPSPHPLPTPKKTKKQNQEPESLLAGYHLKCHTFSIGFYFLNLTVRTTLYSIINNTTE